MLSFHNEARNCATKKKRSSFPLKYLLIYCILNHFIRKYLVVDFLSFALTFTVAVSCVCLHIFVKVPFKNAYILWKKEKKRNVCSNIFCQQFTLNWLVFFYIILPLAFFFAERKSILWAQVISSKRQISKNGTKKKTMYTECMYEWLVQQERSQY